MYIKLPNLKRVKCYEDFYKLLLKRETLGGVNVSHIYLTKQNEKVLKQHIKRVMRKKHMGCTKKFWDYSFAMYWLGYSPSTASDKTRNGYAFVEDV